MRTLRTLSLVVFALTLMTFTSCDKIKSIADVKFEAEMSADIDATSASETLKATGLYAFSGSEVIDPTEDDDINEYWDMIKEWNIQKIIVTIKSIDEPAQLDHASLLLKDDNTGAELYSVEVHNLALQNGTKILEVTEADWTKLVNTLNSKHKIYAAIEGSIDKPSVHIIFRVKIYTKVTANPL